MTVFVIRAPTFATPPELTDLDGSRFVTPFEARAAIAALIPGAWFAFGPSEQFVQNAYRTHGDAVMNAYGLRPWLVIATIEQRNHEYVE